MSMPSAKLPKKILARQHEITADFLTEIDKHLADILSGKAVDMFEIKDLADVLHIHPTHLSNTIKHTTDKSPCYFFEEKIMNIAKNMLLNEPIAIAEVARILTFDPSNFTKFFKRFEGCTPKQFRETHFLKKLAEKTETITI